MNTNKISEAQRQMLCRLADMGGFVSGEDVQRDDSDPNRRTWAVSTKLAIVDKGFVKRTNSTGTLHMTREGYAAIGRDDEF